MKLQLLVGACVVVGVGAVATVVQASIPGPGGVINGCYKNSGGDLRVIDSSGTCKNNETALNWHQTGPKGPQGPQGSPGPAGPAGGALGYAAVADNGTLLVSKGVSQITHPNTGVWCFGLSFTPHVAVATVTGFSGAANQIIHTSVLAAKDACTGTNPTDAAAIMSLPNGGRTDTGFYIEFN
jgi:hypothetical protein